MIIEFFWGSSFCGSNFYVSVNGVDKHFGINNYKTAIEDIIKYLKEEYNIDYNPDDIDFKWDGTL